MIWHITMFSQGKYMSAPHPCCVREQLMVSNAEVHAKQIPFTTLRNPEYHIFLSLSYERCYLAYTAWLKIFYCIASSHQWIRKIGETYSHQCDLVFDAPGPKKFHFLKRSSTLILLKHRIIRRYWEHESLCPWLLLQQPYISAQQNLSVKFLTSELQT